MLLLLAQLALAKDMVYSQTALVNAPPERVTEVLANMQHWPVAWGLAESLHPTQFHVRGRVGSVDQEMLFATGDKARGRVELVAVRETGVHYQATWTQTPTVRTTIPLIAHEGHIEIVEEDGATRVNWIVERSINRAERVVGLGKRLETDVEGALTWIKQRAEADRAEPEQVVKPVDAVLLWSGFHHRWTYNHRINRSGDWFTVPECADLMCKATQVHAAASGSGEDRATFEGFGALLAGQGIQGWYGSLDLWFDGKEDEVLRDRACVTLPEGVPEGPVLMRGYDLDAVTSADSLWGFAVDVSRQGQRVCANATVQMACHTPECGTEDLTTYALRVPFVVATGPDLQVVPHELAQEYSWKADSLRDELEPDDYGLTAVLPGTRDRPAALGLQGFSVQLDKAEHTLGLDVAVHHGPEASEGSDGLPIEAELVYVQWGPVEIAPLTVAQFAHAGKVRLTAKVVALQPQAGCVTEVKTSGKLYWPGKSADASVPTAEHRAKVEIGSPCLPSP